MNTALNARQAQFVNRMLGRLWPNIVAIHRREKTGTVDEEGRQQYQRSLISPLVNARLIHKTSREMLDGEWYTVGSWHARLPAGTEIDVRDYLVDDMGRRFEVESVDYGRLPDGTPTMVRCDLRLIDTGGAV